MLIKENGKIIQITINDAGDDECATGMRIKPGVFPETIIVKQRQQQGPAVCVEYVRKPDEATDFVDKKDGE
jgi:hypothetical protein